MALGQFVNSFLERRGLQVVRVKARRRPRPGEIVQVPVGRYTIDVPAANPIADMYRDHPSYSSELGRIARVVASKYPDAFIVDVGANVGDTAAVIRTQCDAPILAVEGDRNCFIHLQKNVKTLGNVTPVNRFLGEASGSVRVAVAKEGWNTTLQPTAQGAAGVDVEFATLDDLLSQQSNSGQVRLIKTDTEGFDFRIIRGASKRLAENGPVLYFEMNRENLDPLGEDAMTFLSWLRERGYSGLLVWDATGRFIGQYENVDSVSMRDMIDYIGKGVGEVAYYDVAAFHSSDADILATAAGVERSHRLEPRAS